jgi:POT family proton-dependent oligopeptide transporter
MWERFSYYGMRALLILFMTASTSQGGLGFDASQAGVIYGLYTAMVYLAALPGGWLADRFLGLRRAVLYGGIIIALGHFSMAFPSLGSFYLGLALIVIGTGLLKPNVSSIVGQLYAPGDSRRDAGFSIFYMGINLGAFTAPLVCGVIGQKINWHYGFSVAGIGMTLGIIQYVLGSKRLGQAGLHPVPPADAADAIRQRRYLVAGLGVGTVLLIGVVAAANGGLVTARDIADASGALLTATVVIFFVWLFASGSWTPIERRRLIVIAGLFLASALFWSVFEQAGSTMNLFAQRSTDNRFGEFEAPASWYQSVQPLFIITLAPVFAWLWMRLGSKDPSSPAKFSLALAFVGFGFIIMAGGAVVASTGVKVSPAWLLITYLLHTLGELCLSPVGLSAMTKLAPARVAGLMMGVWFMSLSLGNYIGGRLASLYEALPLPWLFGAVGTFAVAAAVILALFIRPMVRLMGGIR